MKKKLLLVGVAAMGLLAVGVGATSTFAWFGVSTSANAALKTGEKTDISVTKIDYSIGAISVKMTISATTSTANLGLAHFVAKNTAYPGTPNTVENQDKAVSPFLTTGYYDGTGTFVDLGYNSDGTANVTNMGGISATSLVLTSGYNIAVGVDYSDSHWKKSDKSTQASADGSDAAYYIIDENEFDKDTILGLLDASKIDIGIKPQTSSRIKFIGAGDAKTGDDSIAAGLTTFTIDTGTGAGTWLTVESDVSTTNGSRTFTFNGSGTDAEKATRYYVFGEKGSAAEAANISEDLGVDLIVRAHA